MKDILSFPPKWKIQNHITYISFVRFHSQSQVQLDILFTIIIPYVKKEKKKLANI